MPYTYAENPAAVDTDAAGNVLVGRHLEVYTAKNGAQITDLQDLAGNPIGNFVATDSNGRYPFQIDSTSWPVVWMRSPNGEWWEQAATGLLSQVPAATLNAATAAADASAALTAVGQIAYTVDTFGAVGDGTTNDRQAVQDAVDAVEAAGGGRLIFSPGKTYLINGSAIEPCSNIEFQMTGATLIKTQQSPIAMFAGLSHGATGYGSGPSNVKFTGGYFRGDLAAGIGITFELHHVRNWVFEDCIFEQCQRAGHLFDIGGSEWVFINRCKILGQDIPSETQFMSQETIQVDASIVGSPSYPDPGSYDGLFTRHVFVTETHFLPVTVGAVTYPAPNCILGSHAPVEGHYYEDIHIDNCYVENPAQDDVNAETDPYKGLIHLVDVRGLYVNYLTVKTDDPANLTIVQIINANQGRTAESDFNVSPDPNAGIWATPNTCKTIKIRGLTVEGFTQPVGSLNPKSVISIAGTDAGTISDVSIEACTLTDNNRPLRLRNTDLVRVIGNDYDDCTLANDIDVTVTRLYEAGNSDQIV